MKKPVWIFPLTVVLIATALIGYVLLKPEDDTAGKANTAGTGTAGEPVAERGASQSADQAVDSPLVTRGAPTSIQGPPETDFAALVKRDPDDPLAVGDPQAPVVLVVISDYQCAFCADWNAQTLPVMMSEVDAGNLRIEWRDTTLFGPPSRLAAQAAYAAGMQGRFRDYHDALFEGGHPRSQGGLSETALLDLAAELNLDQERFAQDMHSPETIAVIDANEAETVEKGTFSTPSFVLGGEPLVGAQPTQVFVDALAEALARAPEQAGG